MRGIHLKIEALSRLGELLAEMPKNHGANGSRVTGSKREPVKDDRPTYRELGIGKKEAAIAQQLAALPADTRHAIARQEGEARPGRAPSPPRPGARERTDTDRMRRRTNQ